MRTAKEEELNAGNATIQLYTTWVSIRGVVEVICSVRIFFLFRTPHCVYICLLYMLKIILPHLFCYDKVNNECDNTNSLLIMNVTIHLH